MKRKNRTMSLGALAAIAAFGIAALAPAETRAEGPCVRAFPEARFSGLGFNHIVRLVNSCTAAADCAVSTDVNPEVQTVTVGGGSEASVVTFLGSPARVFVPRVTCRMHDHDSRSR